MYGHHHVLSPGLHDASQTPLGNMSLSMPKLELSSPGVSWSRSHMVCHDEANMIMIFVAKRGLGVYLLIFMQCMQVLRRRQSPPGGYLVGTAVPPPILVTVVSSEPRMHRFLYRCGSHMHLKHLVTNMGTPNYPDTYYANFDIWKNILKSLLYVAVTIISDAFVVSLALSIWPPTVV